MLGWLLHTAIPFDMNTMHDMVSTDHLKILSYSKFFYSVEAVR